MSSTLTDVDKGYGELLEVLGELEEGASFAVVGIRSAAGGEDVGGGFNLASLAAVHEFGSEKAGVPERSFLRSTADAQQEFVADRLEKAAAALVDPDRLDRQAAYERELGLLGVAVAGKVQQAIANRTIGGPPLAESTIERKTRAGKKGDVPLIDTGRLRQSIDSEVRKA